MRLQLAADSRVLIDLRAAGLLGAVGHDPTLSAAPSAVSLEVPEGGGAELDCAVEARIPVDAIEPPADMSASDRAQMRDNLRGPDVLDARRWPNVDFRGRFAGTLERGRLSGHLVVRGIERAVAIDVSISRRGSDFVAEGDWVGTLTELGIKPFRALLGALKLKDWTRLRLRLRWKEA
jgi:polyisoprenoid-binding protein YceI